MSGPGNKFREGLGWLLVLACGLLPRLIFISRFPTIPTSDFHALVAFGQHLATNGLLAGGWFWEDFNPGMSAILSGLFHLFPSFDPAAVSRMSTVLLCGLVPVLPFAIWRGVVPFWVRLLAGCGLGLWPGQIVFSGTVAQDNWVIAPTVALGCLAVRALFDKGKSHPIVAGLLFAAGAATRQEMLVVLFPLFLVAALRRPLRWNAVAISALALLLPLFCLAGYRYAATGRFALGTEHGGMSILGAYIPGAASGGWIDPYPYVASVRPDLLQQRKALLAYAPVLAVQEALRRPGFHLARITAILLDFGLTGEAANLYWCLGSPEVLPPALHARGEAVALRLDRFLHGELLLIHGLFVAAIVLALLRRNYAILLLALAVALKYAVHGVTVAQGRYFLPVTALAILAIVLALHEAVERTPAAARRRVLTFSLAAGAAACAVLVLLGQPLAAFVAAHDKDVQRRYRFVLEPDRGGGGGELGCVVDRGRLMSLEWPPWSAALRTFDVDPSPGEAAVADCELTGSGQPRPLVLRILDNYAPGGFQDRMLQRVEVDGAEVYSHDIAREPGSGWADVSLGAIGQGVRKKVKIEVRAIRPDRGPGWGNAAETKFQLWRPE